MRGQAPPSPKHRQTKVGGHDRIAPTRRRWGRTAPLQRPPNVAMDWPSWIDPAMHITSMPRRASPIPRQRQAEAATKNVSPVHATPGELHATMPEWNPMAPGATSLMTPCAEVQRGGTRVEEGGRRAPPPSLAGRWPMPAAVRGGQEESGRLKNITRNPPKRAM